MEKARWLFPGVSALSAGVVVTVVLWAFSKYPAEAAFGQRFVMDEIAVIPWLGVYFKPVTIMVIFAFVAWACALESLRGLAERLSPNAGRLIAVVFCMVAFVFAYEVIWNFAMWSDARILSPNTPVDILSNNLDPSITQPRDFAYVTKVDSLYVAVSLYSVFFLRSTRSTARSTT